MYSFSQAFREALRAEWLRTIRVLAAEAEATGGQKLPRPLSEMVVERTVKEMVDER